MGIGLRGPLGEKLGEWGVWRLESGALQRGRGWPSGRERLNKIEARDDNQRDFSDGRTAVGSRFGSLGCSSLASVARLGKATVPSVPRVLVRRRSFLLDGQDESSFSAHPILPCLHPPVSLVGLRAGSAYVHAFAVGPVGRKASLVMYPLRPTFETRP
jgi:hypothetical protein